jgi:N-glycosylase/DNA lyase
MKLKLKEPLNLEFTLNSGQAFNWKKKEFWEGTIKGKKARIGKSGNNLFFEGVEKRDVENFFKLDESLNYIRSSIMLKSNDRLVEKLFKKYEGLRILRQDPWECLISFIISQQSSIQTIKKRVERLYSLNNGVFPDPETLSRFSEEDFKRMNFGYRSGYIKKSSEIIANGFQLERLKEKSFEETLEELKSLPGVGDKVAKCVMLFSLDFNEAFPVDTHIEKIMRRHYRKKKNIQEFAVKHFGDYAGYAQQYLFFNDVF